MIVSLRFLLPALAALAFAAPACAADAGFTGRTTGDLAGLCSGGQIAAERTAAENFCHGYAQGVLELMLAHEKGAVCLPDRPPSRTQTMAEFVTWTKAKEERAATGAARGMEAFFKSRFPCNK